MTQDLVLGDDLGPHGQRRVRIVTVLALIALASLGYLIVRRFQDRGQLDWTRWEPLLRWSSLRFLGRGLVNTVAAAALAMLLGLTFGAVLCLARTSPSRPLVAVSTVAVEVLRATPLVLLIYFMGQFLPRYAVRLSPYWYLVAGLAAYNGAVLAEVFRAGLRSLGAGQREASLAIGLTEWQALTRVLFPQGARRMVPAIVNQLVTLLKDTSLGALVLVPAVEDLLNRGKVLGEFARSPLQALLLVAVPYILVNAAVSRVAVHLEGRRSTSPTP